MADALAGVEGGYTGGLFSSRKNVWTLGLHLPVNAHHSVGLRFFVVKVLLEKDLGLTAVLEARVAPHDGRACFKGDLCFGPCV